MKRQTLQLLCLVALAAATFFVGLGDRGLWNPVEPRYAGIAEDMAEGGLRWVPEYAGELYDQKPGVYFWLTALIMRTGLAEPLTLVRLPSALGGLLLLLGTWRLGRLFFGDRAGFMAAAMLATTWLVFWSARFCHLDTLMTAAVVWCVWAMVRAERAVAAGERRGRFVLLAGLAMGFGLLLKGPAALLYPAAAIAGTALFERDAGWLRRSGLLRAAGIAAAMAAAWFIPAWIIAGNAWAWEIGVNQGVLRLMDETIKPKHERLYYLRVFWSIAAPWSVLLPLAFLMTRRGRLDAGARTGVGLLRAWLIAVVMVLAFNEAPRSRYLMALLPASVLLTAVWIERAVLADRVPLARIALLALGGTILGVSGVAGVAVLAARGGLTLPGGAVGEAVAATADAGAAIPLAGLVVLAGTWGLVATCRARVRRMLTGAVVAMAAVVAYWGLCGAPVVDARRGDAAMLDFVERHLAEGRRIVMVGHYARRESTAGFFAFHLDAAVQPVGTDGRELAELRSREAVCVLLPDKERRRSPAAIPAGYRRVGENLGHARFHVYVNPPQEPE